MSKIQEKPNAMLFWVCLFIILEFACSEILIPPPHPFAGVYPLVRYRAFGPQLFSNVTLPLVILTNPELSMEFCLARNLSKLDHLRGKLVGLIYPYFTAVDPQTVLFLWGCAIERMIGVADMVQVAGLLTFATPVNGQLELLFFHSCYNCSVFDPSHLITFPVVQVDARLAFAIWEQYVLRGEPSAVMFPETNVTLVKPDFSAFEVTNSGWGYAFQVVFSIWCLANLVFCVAFLLSKALRSFRGRSRNEGKSVPMLVVLTLSLELICNAWRLSFVVVDPWLTNQIYSEVDKKKKGFSMC